MAVFNGDLILHAGQRTELSFNNDAVIIGIFDDLTRERDVVLKRLRGSNVITDVKPPSMQDLQSSKVSP